MDYDHARENGLIERFNPTPAYFDHLRTLIDLDAISDDPQHIVVDSMFGSGRGLIKGLLQGTGCEVHEIRGEMNPGFGGIHPEPVMRYLGALSGAIAAGRGALGLATDGDGDRIGAMDGRGEFVDPHRIMTLSLKYLIENRESTGKVVKTISTTSMLNRLAKKHGLEVIETPVGFDHIAELMLNDDVLIGGEESGGISFKGHIPEGDGVLMGLLLVEMVCRSGVSMDELVAEVLKEAGPSDYRRLDLRLSRPVPKQELINQLESQAPESINGISVASVNASDGVKYMLEDDSWLLVRPSGTEPVLRIYAEAPGQDQVQALIEHGRSVASVA
jgi:phosphomannomutase